MFGSSADDLRWGNAHVHFLSHLSSMPGWHRLVLILGSIMAVGGGVSQIATKTTGMSDAQQQQQQTQQSKSVVTNSKSLVDSPTAEPAPADRQPVAEVPLLGKVSPRAMRIGISVLAGFLLGWLFRAFIRTVAFFAVAAGGILMALSYFRVINIDFSSARGEYATAMHWLTDQGTRIKDIVIAHLPSTGGGSLGAFLGFRRR